MPVKQSASKEEFLRALGLNVSDPDDKRRLQAMWEEVTGYWVRHFETTRRDILKPEYAASPGVQRPYKWAHLDPGIIDSAIAQIWKDAGPYPRQYYERGRTDDRKVYNWVLKWLLWHVCRYRDWRNRKTRSSGSSGSSTSSSQTLVLADSNGLPPHDYWATVMNPE